MYKLSKKLIEVLSKNKISYCHWKSNLLLDEALAGYDDLDLLVMKSDIQIFESLILNLGFKEGSDKNLNIPSVKHFYGYDKDSGQILHLHVYYQIKTGPSWTKFMRLDIEEVIFDNLILHKSGMPIPEKHIEFVIFIIRIMMKYSKFNEYILVKKEESRTKKEIIFLLEGMDKEKLDVFLKKCFTSLTIESLFNYVKIIQNGNFITRFIQAIKLKRKLDRYLYQGILLNTYNNLAQFKYRLLNKIFYKQKKKLHAGGTIIVVAGLDATGKTTITNDLKKWLGKNLSISLSHFGKPDSTLLTLPINLLIKIARRRTSIEGELRSSTKTKKANKSYLFLIRQVVLAYDRYSLVSKLWRKSTNGNIVICDRYKSEMYGVMDSKRLIVENYSGFKRRLAIIENKYYDLMPEPDLMFYLTVPVEVAVQRNEDRIKKGKESEYFLKLRHAQNQDLSYKAKVNVKIDTNRDYLEVIGEIKELIWKNI
jgi:thymidylate kinase